jgi:O-antigen/teichoic acid export membrane protein
MQPSNGLDEHFRTEHLQSDLGQRSASSGAITLLSQAAKLLMQVSSTVLLARLLTPKDYGLFGIVLSLIAFGTIFGDLGLPTATLQSNEINHKQVSTLFWLNMAQSLIVALIMIASAPLLAHFFKEPMLAPLLVAMSGGSVVYALGCQHQALMRRQMRFTRLSSVEFISMLLGVATAIISAWCGARFWALAYMQLVTTTASTAGCWIACNWRPGAPFAGASVRPLLHFGKNITASNMCACLNRNLDNLLIGHYCGVGPLGLYDKAFQLHMLPMQQISWPVTGVAQATLSRLGSDSARFDHYAKTMVLLLSGICMPVIAFLFVKADVIVWLMLGSSWQSVVPIFRALGPAAFVEVVLCGVSWIAVSYGQTSRLLQCRIAQTILTIAALLVGIRWGTIGVAIAISISRIISLLPSIVFCSAATPVKWNKLATAPLYPMLASITAAIAVQVVDSLLGFPPHQILYALFDSVLFVATYACIWICFPNSRSLAAQIFQAMNIARKARSLTPAQAHILR